MVELINNIELDIINLYSNNYKAYFHVREMAKKISKSHVALLPYLKEFEKKNILVSKRIGKNKIFSLNLNNPLIKELISISEKKKTIEFLSQDEFFKELYDKILSKINCCIVLVNNKENNIIKIIALGDIEKTSIIEFGKKYNKNIIVLSGKIEQFRIQLKNKTQMIKDIEESHIILKNHDILINELWNYYKS